MAVAFSCQCLCVGCGTVRVTSDPPGARVYQASGMSNCGPMTRGGAPYPKAGVEGIYRGVTPLSYTRGMYAYDNVRVEWPDGEDSGWDQQADLSSFVPQTLTFHFIKGEKYPDNATNKPPSERPPRLASVSVSSESGDAAVRIQDQIWALSYEYRKRGIARGPFEDAVRKIANVEGVHVVIIKYRDKTTTQIK